MNQKLFSRSKKTIMLFIMIGLSYCKEKRKSQYKNKDIGKKTNYVDTQKEREGYNCNETDQENKNDIISPIDGKVEHGANKKFIQEYSNALEKFASGKKADLKDLVYLLEFAAEMKSPKYLRLFFDYGACPNNKNDFNIIHFIIGEDYDMNLLKCLKIIVEYDQKEEYPYRIDYNFTCRLGYPPFKKLIFRKEAYKYIKFYLPEYIKIGIKIDIHKTDTRGLNALYWAVEEGKYELVPLLESMGLKWIHNLNPLAKTYGNENCVIMWYRDDSDEQSKIYQCYVREGVDWTRIMPDRGRSILHFAWGDEKLINHLVRYRGIDPNILDDNNKPFINGYVRFYNHHIYKDHLMIYPHLPGINLNLFDGHGYTYLFYYVCSEGACIYLDDTIEAGADPLLISKNGYSLIQIMCTNIFIERLYETLKPKKDLVIKLLKYGVEFLNKKTNLSAYDILIDNDEYKNGISALSDRNFSKLLKYIDQLEREGLRDCNFDLFIKKIEAKNKELSQIKTTFMNNFYGPIPPPPPGYHLTGCAQP